jgi:glycosyltransferase involved in cell wall biosynthesis
MKILLLSAYDAASHQRWYHTLIGAFDQFEWTTLRLAPRHFNWRIRGNSLSWAFTQRHVLERDYDLVVATSMIDLSTLRGFVPSLANVPTLVYFHENQFAYPPSSKQFSTVEPQILNLYTALAADQIVFNSHYNYETFISGVGGLLKKLPDHVPLGLVDRLKNNSQVLPVPLADDCYHQRSLSQVSHLSVLWNHRWEYDKAPERLFGAMKKVLEAGVAIDCHIVGQQFRQIPEVFTPMKAYLEQHPLSSIKHWGFLDEENYQQLLTGVDVVVSTALHDFQGLAILEAVAAGCIPVVPDRLCYAQWFDAGYRYKSHLDQPELEAEALAATLIQWGQHKTKEPLPKAPCLRFLSMAALHEAYDGLFQQTINRFNMSRVS